MDAETHLDQMLLSVKESEFTEMDSPKGMHCVIQLFRYCAYIQRILQLQKVFPEYFDPGQPDWFRTLMRLKLDFDRCDINRRLELACMCHLEHRKRKTTSEGRSWRHVAEAVHTNAAALNQAKNALLKRKAKLSKFLLQLRTREAKKVTMLQDIARARELAVVVAKANLREYSRVSYIPDEAILKELQYKVDSTTLALLLTLAELSIHTDMKARNEMMRDFDAIMQLDDLHKMCSEAGMLYYILLTTVMR